MMIILLYDILVTFIDILEIINEQRDQITGEVLTNSIIFKNMKVKIVIYLVEMDAFSNVLIISSTKTLV